MIIDFKLLPEIQWSDGVLLTAEDSVYSYQVFKYLFENANPDILKFTQSYSALDDKTVEWVGIPGYVGTVVPKFFSPLPEHILGVIGIENLLTSESSTRTPVGWGPYIIEEWVAGDHITLSKNLNYFRSLEGLPHFDNLVYRFMQDGDEAIDALQVGECDFIDRTLLTEEHIPRLKTAQDQGLLTFSVQTGTAWELTAFDIEPIDTSLIRKFDNVEVRRAIAMCIDRQKMVDELLFGISNSSDTYVPLNHPLYNSEVSKIEFNPGKAGDLLDAIGWIDQDSDPSTPRVAQGVEGVADGTPFEITYLVPSDAERPEAAQIVKEGLNTCGIGIDVVVSDWDTLMAPGPDGPLFGRQFEMTQFAWVASNEPSCNLFMSDEIPGQYPDYPKGWGGANLTGYSSAEFDASCRQARFSIPGSETYIQAHHDAQAIFANDLPVIPLYQRLRLVAMRAGLCNLVLDPASNSALSSLEMIDYGENCE
jgi:peptide/nickel transport system substrate-binding protein